jgi:hypothetical protein
MGTLNVHSTRSAGGGVWQAMAIALAVLIVAALAAYYVFGVGSQNYSPGTPYNTGAPVTGAPATAPAAPTVNYP